MNPQSLHKWEATGVSGYPITHPIVGQGDFYRKFKHFLELVADEDNRFAHVFAVVAPWGVGKSRLGYEVVAQVNDTSKGWKVRGSEGGLEEARLFSSDGEREGYLALYIRYSQVAHEQLNLDNWFAPALYRALEPLARASFDSSIQHQIARQAHARLTAEGFDAADLTSAMELDQHGWDAIYADTALATRLCSAAYEVLAGFGIRYIVVVLDELETAAERATAGLEVEEARAMDGKAITMLRKAVETLGVKTLERQEIEAMSKAVKEEDARARFPWLRFVTLCSPAIGDELKEVQSTDRRFEIVDLTKNAFSDVADFVKSLEEDGRLLRPYPKGLVEAAYMMSGGNFGWFNVVMAIVDQVLKNWPPGDEASLTDVFLRTLQVSNRIQRHVLDHRCLDELSLTGGLRDAATKLLLSQLPVSKEAVDAPVFEQLLTAKNAYGEPVAGRYQRFTWLHEECTNVLIQNRFRRTQGSGTWTAPGIPEPIDLEHLLSDLSTLAIHETSKDAPAGSYNLILPQSLPEFLQLLDLIHPHPAVEEVGRTLWTSLVGGEPLLKEQATHIGPSVDMLRRLDIRLRKTSTGTVLRDPQENEAYERTMSSLRFGSTERSICVLTGMMRLLDENWNYDPETTGFGNEIVAIRTNKEGLLDFKALALHPKAAVVLAWAASDQMLVKILEATASAQSSEGRFPLVVLTSDYGMPERFSSSKLPQFEKARDYTMVLHLNSAEESALESIGLSTSLWTGFRLRREGFTTRFSERLNRIKTPAGRRVREWRHEVSERGGIAWPLRPNGTLKEEARKTLVEAWKIVMLQKDGQPLDKVGPAKGLDYPALLQVLGNQGLSPAAGPKGYTPTDQALLWMGEADQARPNIPGFLLRVVDSLFSKPTKRISLNSVRSEWLWGYTWDGNKVTDIFREWMAVLVDLGWADVKEEGKQFSYGLAPRSKLEGDLAAANNWLQKGYRLVAKKLAEIVGPGIVDAYFKPGTGSKYQKAEKQLKEAKQELEALSVLEANPPELSNREEANEWLVKTTRLRLRIRDRIAQVFDKEGYEKLTPVLDERVLNLHDDEKPLWERLRHAEHFTDAVRTLAQRIRERTPALRDEMSQDVEKVVGFPLQLFTRPLMKILDMVDPGLTGEDPSRSVHRAQQAQPYTLAYYLKELRVAETMDALEKLGREVGVSRHSSDFKPLAEIQGEILAGFRDLKKRYAEARQAVDSMERRIKSLEAAVVDPPDDFAFPTQVSLDQVRGRPELIRGELESVLEETVEELLNEHNDAMNLGQFTPLMREVRTRLLNTQEQAIKGLEGKLLTMENAVSKYRQDLVSRPELLDTRRGLNVLRRAKGSPEKPPVGVAEVEPHSLRDGLSHVLGRIQMWKDEGDKLLNGIGVAFEEWKQLVTALDGKSEPSLTAQQMNALVEAGFVKRVYALP